MVSRTWLEVPANYDTPTSAGRPKYPVSGSGLVVYRGSKAYVSFENASAKNELIRHPDVRALTLGEARRLEDGLPFPLSQSLSGGSEVRLGDLVHQLTKRVGIAECGACRKRRRILNRVVIWAWWRRSKTLTGKSG
jgi:hypothetical protein